MFSLRLLVLTVATAAFVGATIVPTSARSDKSKVADFLPKLRAQIALRLLGCAGKSCEVAGSKYRIQYNWESGKALSSDPVKWAAELPACVTSSSKCKSLKFNFLDGSAVDAETMKLPQLSECLRAGFVNPGSECGLVSEAVAAGGHYDVTPEAKSARQKAEEEERRVRAEAQKIALNECPSILETLKTSGAGGRVKRACRDL